MAPGVETVATVGAIAGPTTFGHGFMRLHAYGGTAHLVATALACFITWLSAAPEETRAGLCGAAARGAIVNVAETVLTVVPFAALSVGHAFLNAHLVDAAPTPTTAVCDTARRAHAYFIGANLVCIAASTTFCATRTTKPIETTLTVTLRVELAEVRKVSTCAIAALKPNWANARNARRPAGSHYRVKVG